MLISFDYFDPLWFRRLKAKVKNQFWKWDKIRDKIRNFLGRKFDEFLIDYLVYFIHFINIKKKNGKKFQ